MTGALGDVEVATYDANTAAAKLTKSLFDANGKLTEHAKKALTTNTALADLAKKSWNCKMRLRRQTTIT